MKRATLLSIVLLLSVLTGWAQTTLNTTVGSTGYDGTNGLTNNYVTFVIDNTSGTDIILTDVGSWVSSADNGDIYTLWYSSTSLSGAPPTTLALPAWNVVGSGALSTSAASESVNPVITGLSFIIPAATTYRFALHTDGALNYSGSTTNTPSPNTFTSSGVTLAVGNYQIAGANVGYGGSANTPRFFTGSISFIPASPCINPPYVGPAQTTVANPCAGQSFQLTMDSVTFGTGQTYQWESSPDDVVWTPISGATSSSYTTTQSASTYYRCAVTCGTTVNSASVLVTTSAFTTPVAQNFDNHPVGSTTNPSPPPCWTAYETPGHAGYQYTYATLTPNSPPQHWRFYNGSNITDSLILISPAIQDLNLSTKAVTFWLKSNTASYNTRIIVGTVADPLQPNTFDPVDTVFGPQNYTQFTSNITTANGYNGTHSHIAFMYVGVASAQSGYLDDVVIDDIPPCPNPSALTASFIAGSYVDLTWTAGTGSATSWDIQYGLDGFSLGSGTTITVASNNPATVSGLTGTTDYDFYVREACPGQPGMYSNWVGPLSVTTDCAPETTPYTEDFEGQFVGWQAKYANCWTSNPGATSTSFRWETENSTGANENSLDTGPWYDNTTPSTSGGIYVFMETSSGTLGDTATFVSPLVDLSGLTDPFLEFYYHMYGATTGTLEVLVQGSSGGWTQLWSLSGEQQTAGSDPFALAGIDLAAYSGQTVRVKFRGTRGSSFTGDMSIDDVSFVEAPSCIWVNNIQAFNITGSGADITWLSGGNNFNVEWGPCGFSQGTGTFGTPTNDTLSISGLSANTCYDVYVQNNCGVNGTSIWTGPYSFTTAIVPDWLEEFNTYIPARWLEAQGPVGEPTTFTSISPTASGWLADGWLNSGTTGSAREIISGTIDDEWLISPPIDLGTGNTYQLEYDVAVTASGGTGAGTFGTDDTAMVIISTDGGTTWNRSEAVRTYHAGNQPSEAGLHEVIDLTGYSGVIQIGFYVESTVTNNSTDFFIDNVRVRIPPACPGPFALILDSVDIDFARISWTPTGNYNVEWGTTGFGQGTGTTAVVTGDSLVQITGLMGSTTYDFYIQTDCGSGILSAWVGPFSFTTLCGIESSPYTEDFETVPPGYVQDLINCWTSLPGATSTGFRWEAEDATGSNENSLDTGPWYDNTTPTAAGGMYMYMETSSGTAGDTATLISPSVDLTGLTTPFVQFYYHMYGATTGTLELLAQGPSGSWDLLWTLSGEQQTAGSDPFEEGGAVLTAYAGQTVRFKFRGTRGTSFTGDISVDDFGVIEMPYCAWVNAGANITGITGTGATIDWSGVGASFDLEWGPAGFIQGSGTGNLITGATSPYSFTGLNPLTTYDVYIQANCAGGGSSPWVGPITFTTVCLSTLSGSYTVGGAPGPNNFPNLDTLSFALNGCGIGGPVTVTVQDTAVGSLQLNNVAGVSSVNTITITGNGTGTMLGGSSAPYVVIISGTDYVTVSDVNVIGYAPGVSISGVLVTGDADSVTLDGLYVLTDSTTTSSLISGIAVSNSTTSATTTGADVDYLTVENCTVVGGYRGVSLYGQSTTIFPRNTGAVIRNNVIRQPYYYGIYSYTQAGVDIVGNNIYNVRYTSFGYGIYMSYTDNFELTGNQVKSPYYGVYMTQLNNSSSGVTSQSTMANNMVVSGTNAALYMTTANKINLYHNSFKGTYGLRMFTSTDQNHRNNIFYGSSNYAWESSVALASGDVVDYNLYYTGGTNLIKEGTPTYANLAAWQTANATQNVNSLEGDPIFVSAEDLHLIGSLANDEGVSVGITTDIDGDTRPASGATAVDIGADEYTPLTDDLSLETIFGPSGGCGDSAVAIYVHVRNLGLGTISAFSATVNVTGSVTTTLNSSFSGSIPSTGEDTLLVGTVNIYNGGTISMTGSVTLTGDQDLTNNNGAAGPFNYIPFEPSAYPGGTFCPNLDSAYVAAPTIPGASYGWYSSMADSVPLAVGDTFNFALPSQTTYYMGYYATGAQSLSTLFTGGNSCGGGNMVDVTATNTILIDSLYVKENSTAGTPVTINIYYIANGTYAGNETNAGAWTLHEAVSTVSAGTNNPTSVPLTTPLVIPAGSTYGVYINFNASYTDGNGTNQVYTNSDMTVAAGIGLCSLFGGTNNPRVFNGTFHYRAGNTCSTDKIPVTITLEDSAVAAFSFTANNYQFDFDASGSTNAQVYDWDFGDGNTGTGVTTSHTYTANGNYTVTLTVTDTACGSTDVATQSIQLSIGLAEELIDQTLNLYPNPSSGKFAMEFSVEGLREVSLEILSVTGQVIWRKDLGTVAGIQEQEVDLSEAAKGIYWLRIQTDRGQVTRRVAIQ